MNDAVCVVITARDRQWVEEIAKYLPDAMLQQPTDPRTIIRWLLKQVKPQIVHRRDTADAIREELKIKRSSYFRGYEIRGVDGGDQYPKYVTFEDDEDGPEERSFVTVEMAMDAINQDEAQKLVRETGIHPSQR
jgi:hypothetical protein